MKRFLTAMLTLTIVAVPMKTLLADDLDKLSESTDQLWRRGKGAEDGAFTSIGASMLAWGVGLAVIITLVAVLVEQSTSSSK